MLEKRLKQFNEILALEIGINALKGELKRKHNITIIKTIYLDTVEEKKQLPIYFNYDNLLVSVKSSPICADGLLQ